MKTPENIIVSKEEIATILAPADPCAITQFQGGVYSLKWKGNTVPEDELKAVRANARIEIASQRDMNVETDGVSGYVMLVKVRPERDWVPTWLEIGKKNPWIKDANDPQFDADSFCKCATVEELLENIGRHGWSTGVAFYYGDLCFINQDEGGSEWLVIKQDCAFESFSGKLMAENPEYPLALAIKDVQAATLEQCRELEYAVSRPRNKPVAAQAANG
jgi:hypothetical protein